MGGWRRRLGLQGGPEPEPSPSAEPVRDVQAALADPGWAAHEDEFEFVPQFDIRGEPEVRHGPRDPSAHPTPDGDWLLDSVAYIEDAPAAASVPRDSEPSETPGSVPPPAAAGSARLQAKPRDERGSQNGGAGYPEAAAGRAPAPDLPTRSEMSNVETSLKEAAAIDGAFAVALVDYTSGMSLGSAGDTSVLNLDVAAAGNTDVVRAKLRTLEALGLKESIEDILITLSSQYHLIRLLRSASGDGLFLYLVLDKTRANLAMARHKLSVVERNIQV